MCCGENQLELNEGKSQVSAMAASAGPKNGFLAKTWGDGSRSVSLSHAAHIQPKEPESRSDVPSKKGSSHTGNFVISRRLSPAAGIGFLTHIMLLRTLRLLPIDPGSL